MATRKSLAFGSTGEMVASSVTVLTVTPGEEHHANVCDVSVTVNGCAANRGMSSRPDDARSVYRPAARRQRNASQLIRPP
jgi:hypothetical protein